MDDLFPLIPVVKRARGYRLYAFSGRRYLDLHLSGGSDLLGHKPPQFVNSLKQTLERGVISDLPTIYSRRLLGGLRAMFPDYRSFLLAASLPELLQCASRALGRPLSPYDIRDPLLSAERPDGGIFVWRPFSPANTLGELLFPVIPTGLGSGLSVLCLKQPLEPAAVVHSAISSLVLAGAAHCLKLLAALALPAWYTPDLLAKAPHFIQQGVYLVPRCSAAAYGPLFRRFLDAGVVLSPRYPQPSILPFELSPGELNKLLVSFTTEAEGESR